MENQESLSSSSIINTQKRVIIEPSSFYQAMPVEGGFLAPTVFILAMSLLSALILGLWLLFGIGTAAAMFAGLASFVMLPIFTVIASFLGAAALFAIWKLMGSKTSYQAAFRCLAYSTAILPIVAIANLIPYLGQALSIVWGLWLMIIASEHVHQLEPQIPWRVFGVLGIVLLYLNLNAQYQARQTQLMVEDWQEKSRQLTSDQLGNGASDFIAGIRQGSGQPLSPQEKAELDDATQAMAEFAQGIQSAVEELNRNNEQDSSAQNTGKVLGELFAKLDGIANRREQTSARHGPDLLAQVTEQNQPDIAKLDKLGTIEKPPRGLQFEVNESSVAAPLTREVSVYKDNQWIRYRLWVPSAYLSSFTHSQTVTQTTANTVSATAAAADTAIAAASQHEQNTWGKTAQTQHVVVRNAIIYAYDGDGNPVAGDECDDAVLEIPALTQASVTADEQEFWLLCALEERRRI